MTENNRLDCAMSAFHALSQLGTDLERLFTAMASLNGIRLTGASEHVRQAVEDLGLHYNAICKNYGVPWGQTLFSVFDWVVTV